MSINVVVEIPLGERIKYEWDEELNMMKGDRKLTASMVYPGNYGFIPKTRTGDGDALDVLIPTEYRLLNHTVHKCRVLGALLTKDESCVGDAYDEKIIVVPEYDKAFRNINNYNELSSEKLDAIKHFFQHYKDNESGKWVEIIGWLSANDTIEIINQSYINNL